MRELADIVADIDKLNGEKRILDDKLHELHIERGKRQQYDFDQNTVTNPDDQPAQGGGTSEGGEGGEGGNGGLE